MRVVWMHVETRPVRDPWVSARRRSPVFPVVAMAAACVAALAIVLWSPARSDYPVPGNPPASPAAASRPNQNSTASAFPPPSDTLVDLPGGPAAAAPGAVPTDPMARVTPPAASTATGLSPELQSAVTRTAAYTADIASAAETTHLPTALVRAVMVVESEGYPHAVSPTGAEGLMQLEPATARELGVTDPFDPATNTLGGARYLSTLLVRYGGDRCLPNPLECLSALRLALAAYNAGPNAVARYGGIPPYPATQGYIALVISLYQAGD